MASHVDASKYRFGDAAAWPVPLTPRAGIACLRLIRRRSRRHGFETPAPMEKAQVKSPRPPLLERPNRPDVSKAPRRGLGSNSPERCPHGALGGRGSSSAAVSRAWRTARRTHDRPREGTSALSSPPRTRWRQGRRGPAAGAGAAWSLAALPTADEPLAEPTGYHYASTANNCVSDKPAIPVRDCPMPVWAEAQFPQSSRPFAATPSHRPSLIKTLDCYGRVVAGNKCWVQGEVTDVFDVLVLKPYLAHGRSVRHIQPHQPARHEHQHHRRAEVELQPRALPPGVGHIVFLSRRTLQANARPKTTVSQKPGIARRGRPCSSSNIPYRSNDQPGRASAGGDGL